MGPKPKGKNKKKGKNKSDNADGEKRPAEELTFKEAVLKNRIRAVQDQIYHVKSEMVKVMKRNEKQKERNQVLKVEQEMHINHAVAQAKEFELKMDSQPKVEKDEVEAAFYNFLMEGKQHEEEIEGLKRQIKEMEGKHEKALAKILELTEYKLVGQHEDATQIKLMKDEMEDFEASYSEMKESVDESLKTAKEATLKLVASSIERQREAASELAIEDLSQASQQEFMDNKWLLKEVRIHERQLHESQTIVDHLEANNLEIITRMVDKRFHTGDESSPLAIEAGEDQNETLAFEELAITEWTPDVPNEEDLDNYLTYPDDDEEDEETNASSGAPLLYVRGHAMTIELKDEDAERLPVFKPWSTTQLPSDFGFDVLQ